MPRRKQQFSFLTRALKANGNDGKADTLLGEFKNFKSGINKRKAGAIPADARIALVLGVLPFALDLPTATPTDKDYYHVRISKWSNDWRSGAGKLTNTDLGLAKGKATMVSASNFYPAKVLATVFEGTPEEKTSGITKQKYKARKSKSYSIPFGAKFADAAQNSYLESRELIAGKLTAVGVGSVTFQPEQWTSPEKDVAFGE
jgi:hypothetical protein